MNVVPTRLPGVLILEPRVFGDERGYFMESFQDRRYLEAGVVGPFVQDNVSFSRRNILRGLHFQNPNPQGKLVQVLQGEVYDVAVDIRLGAPTFGEWVGITLSSDNKRQFYIPAGFAHGFCVMSETALFFYKCTDYYNAKAETSILWNDPNIGIAWPIAQPQLSTKDSRGQRLFDLDHDVLPRY